MLLSQNLSTTSVVVVGNGASLLGAANGTFIDNHEVVVRFNLFRTHGYCADVGSRTTIWFNNRDASSHQIVQILKAHTFEHIYIHTWTATDQAVLSFRQQLSRLNAATPVSAVDKQSLHEMAAYLGVGYSLFSTGAIGVWTMLQRYRNVTLVGFDWWSPFDRFHYCDGIQFVHNPTRGHQPRLEKRFLDKLHKEGRLQFHGEAATSAV